MEALELAPMKKDKESDYFAMGFRLYDPEIGRFLAIDPLLDVQPSQTPTTTASTTPPLSPTQLDFIRKRRRG